VVVMFIKQVDIEVSDLASATSFFTCSRFPFDGKTTRQT
jgi:hypothetical protein